MAEKSVPIKLVVADDHSMFREMLKLALHHRGERYVVVGESGDGKETLDLVSRYLPDLLLLDYKMPGTGRFTDFCREVKRRNPATRILVVSGYKREEVAMEAVVGGADGYVVKTSSIPDLLDAIAAVSTGSIWVDPCLPRQIFQAFLDYNAESHGIQKVARLTRQELQILSCVSRGMKNMEIGRRLYISRKTVKNHLTHIFDKLEVVSRQEAVVYLSRDKNNLKIAGPTIDS